LDELIHAISRAKNQMMEIEKLTDDELDVLQAKFEKIRAASIARMERKKQNDKAE
jgi:low affinity Fe/Cu permease